MAGASPAHHAPVMLNEVVAAMAPQRGEVIVDATFGAGGYSRALLSAAECSLNAIDRDPDTQLLAEALARDFPGLFFFHAGAFGDMQTLLGGNAVGGIDAIVMDIGVSSMQLDQAQRGFSFMQDGPLDMRMAQAGQSAADIVNGMEEKPLADLIYTYGEERKSRHIARAIVAARAEAPIETTRQVVSVIEKVLPKTGKQHPATRTFQALRIAVNDE